MRWALLLIGGFMVVEAGGGLLSGSLALLADAGHMLTDTAALALGWFAFRAGRKPADAQKSYCHHRFRDFQYRTIDSWIRARRVASP